MKRTIRRGVAATVLTGATLLATPAMASADTLVYQGPAAGGTGHQYYNVNTGVTITTHHYHGDVFDSCDTVVR